MFIGGKRKLLYDQFISKFIPDDIKVYVEPFGGSFAVSKYLKNIPKLLVYNDMNYYPDENIIADKIHHTDYKEIIKRYDSKDTVIYIDPPYFKKEFLYEGCERYGEEFHITLKWFFMSIKGKAIMSYENHPFILELYSDFDIHKYEGERKNFRNEIIITNF